MERAAILCQGQVILPDHLPIELRDQQPSTPVIGIPSPIIEPEMHDEDLSLDVVEKFHIRRVLKKFKGNKSSTARALNISRSTLREKIRLYELAE